MNIDPYIIQWNVNGIESRIKTGELKRIITNIVLCVYVYSTWANLI